MILFLLRLSKAEISLFGKLYKEDTERTIAFTNDEFHQNSYCNSLNSQISCIWNPKYQGYSCDTTDNIINKYDDDCFSYFEKNLTDNSDFKDIYWDYINFTCNASNIGRCYFQIFFDDDHGNLTRCKKYVDTKLEYKNQPISLKRPDRYFRCDSKFKTRKIRKLRAYILPQSLDTAFYNISVTTTYIPVIDKIPNYSEEKDRKEKYPTAFKTQIQTKNNKPAYRATLKLYKDNQSLHLSTMLMEFPYPISRVINSHSVLVPGKSGDQFVSPIIANKTHIFGIDVFNRETFIEWGFNHYEFMRSNTSSLNMKIKPIKDVNISYIIMEANTSSFLEAMEVWHQAFPDLYGINPYGKSSIAISPNTTNWNSEMVTKYGGKLLWGSNNKYNKETKNFYEMNPFIIKVNKYGISKEAELCKRYIIKHENLGTNYYECLVVLSDDVRKYHVDRFKEMNDKYHYSGIAIRNFDIKQMYQNINADMVGIDSVTPYALLDGDDNETFNYQWGLLKLLEELHEYSPDGFLVECKNVHPQLAQYVVSILYSIENKEQNSTYTVENKIGLWNTRFSLGSKVISIMDETGSDHRENWASTTPIIGALPTGYRYRKFDNIWDSKYGIETYLGGQYLRFGEVYEEIFENAKFMANVNGAIKSTDLEYYSGFCKNDNSSCYLSVLQSRETNETYTVNFTDEVADAECFAKGHNLECEIKGQTVYLKSYDQYRTAVIKFRMKSWIKAEETPKITPPPPTSQPTQSLQPLKSNETYAIKSTLTQTITQTDIQTTQITITKENSTFVETEIVTWIHTFVETFFYTSVIFISELEGISKSRLTPPQIILISSIIIVSLFTLAIIGITLWRKSRKNIDDNSDSETDLSDVNQTVDMGMSKSIVLDPEAPICINPENDEDEVFLNRDF